MSVIKRLLDIGYHLHLLIVTTAARRILLTPTFILTQLSSGDKSDQFGSTNATYDTANLPGLVLVVYAGTPKNQVWGLWGSHGVVMG